MKMTIPERIEAALRRHGRPMTRHEMTAWYLSGYRTSEIEAMLRTMAARGMIADLGEVPPPPGSQDLRPRTLYGLAAPAIRLEARGRREDGR